MNNATEKYEVKVKAGLLRTIGQAIYSSPIVKIREAVSNSIDNNATMFSITIDAKQNVVSLLDDGNGIPPQRFKEILGNIGTGSTRSNFGTNSYFGLGLMSVLQMASKATIFTKPKGEDKIYKYVFDSKEIFSESIVNNDIADITSYIHKELVVTENDRSKESPFKFDNVGDIRDLKSASCSYTEILLQGVDDGLLNKMMSDEFKIDLRKELPLETETNDPIFGLFHDNPSALKVFSDMLNDKAVCPTVEVRYNVIEIETTTLYKYYPQFGTNITVRDCDFFYNHEEGKEYAWFYIISTQDLQGELKKKKKAKQNTNDQSEGRDNQSETGFWVRNKNFLVKAADYLRDPKTKKEIISQPLRNWIFGEIFHKNMTSMLAVTRTEFIYEDENFVTLRQELESSVRPKDKMLRDAWRKSKAIIDSLIKPLERIHSGEDFASTYKSLISCNIIEKEEDCATLLSDLGDSLRVPDIEDETRRIDVLLSQNENKELVLLNDAKENIKVIISDNISSTNSYVKTREGNNGGVVLYVSSRLFNPTKTTFLGKRFDLKYVAMSSELADISVNTKSGSIYVNPFNHDISKFKLTFFEVVLAIRIAENKCATKQDMARMIIDIVGNKFYHLGDTSIKCMENLSDSLSKRGQNV